ncbi:hypothetical protein BGW80DRAFT_1309074 [Lactifluus volemus]|nr:hypothetical protein BGW80DRAFT_1309074 [Lactifluus volemus]
MFLIGLIPVMPRTHVIDFLAFALQSAALWTLDTLQLALLCHYFLRLNYNRPDALAMSVWSLIVSDDLLKSIKVIVSVPVFHRRYVSTVRKNDLAIVLPAYIGYPYFHGSFLLHGSSMAS